MLQRLIAARVISSPAIWGKLPGHADFVRSGVRHGESDAWRPWLAEHCETATTDVDPLVVPPASFVLPPATLACSPRHFVVGVIAPSVDRVGRRHPLLVYQMARPRWVERHFRSNAGQPLDWFFWLARVVGHHLRKGSDVMKSAPCVRNGSCTHRSGLTSPAGTRGQTTPRRGRARNWRSTSGRIPLIHPTRHTAWWACATCRGPTGPSDCRVAMAPAPSGSKTLRAAMSMPSSASKIVGGIRIDSRSRTVRSAAPPAAQSW